MPKPTLTQVNQIKDIISANDWMLIIPNVPGASFRAGWDLSLKCTSVNFPGSQQEIIQWFLFGHSLIFRGARQTSHKFEVRFYEDVEFGTYSALRGWLRAVMASDTGNSEGDKQSYTRDVRIEVYDTTGALAKTMHIYGVQPETIELGELNSDQSQPLIITATFAYDYTEDS